MPREQIMDMLWPDEEPSEVSNRLSVALSTVRRALDPQREHDPGRFVAADRSVVRIRTDTVAIDTELFLAATERADTPQLRRAALKSCRGEALVDEPYSDWAVPLRQAVNNVVGDLARTVAAEASADADHVGAAEAYRRLLEVDPYDEVGHLGNVRALEAMGAHGHATKAYEIYRRRCAELGIEPTVRPQ